MTGEVVPGKAFLWLCHSICAANLRGEKGPGLIRKRKFLGEVGREKKLEPSAEKKK